MSEELMVRCPRCRTAFPAPFQVDRATLEALVLTKVYECPHCGAATTYVKADHFYRLDITGEPPE